MASSLLDIQPAMTVACPVDGATIHSTTYIKKKMVRMSFAAEKLLRLILLLNDCSVGKVPPDLPWFITHCIPFHSTRQGSTVVKGTEVH